MKIINPKEHLLVFAQRHCSFMERARETFSYYNDNPGRVHIIHSAESCMGFNEVDILFSEGWWTRRDCDNILELIDTYVFSRTGRVIGDRNQIPDFLWNRYNRKNKGIEDSKKYSRFELLDL